MSNKGIGEFEELVLLAVCILDGQGYGISVKKEVEQHSGRSILLGAIHITLYRLQDKGLLKSALGGSSEKRGDRRKRLFKITRKGMDHLRAAQDVRQKMWELIPQLSSKQNETKAIYLTCISPPAPRKDGGIIVCGRVPWRPRRNV